MDNMDNFRERFEALEQQTEQLKQHTQALEANTRTIEQRLRWWRGIACGVVMLALFSLALPSGKAADATGRGMAERMATLEDKLAAMAFDAASNEVVITGANLRIVNGLGNTRTTNGLGNLIVGYNELRPPQLQPDNRTGSHNVVGGEFNNFSSFGGLVVGSGSEISGQYASVSGGSRNTASGDFSSVSGGAVNTASGRSWVPSSNATKTYGKAHYEGETFPTTRFFGKVYARSHRHMKGLYRIAPGEPYIIFGKVPEHITVSV